MKRNDNFMLSNIAGNILLVPISSATTSFKGLLAINDMGLFLWEKMENDIDFDELIEAVILNFDGASEETIRNDLVGYLDILSKFGCLED